MAYFARLDDNVVSDVQIVADEVENPAEFLAELFGGSWWLETYTDGRRGKQATIGDVYDPVIDEFITPAPPVEEE